MTRLPVSTTVGKSLAAMAEASCLWLVTDKAAGLLGGGWLASALVMAAFVLSFLCGLIVLLVQPRRGELAATIILGVMTSCGAALASYMQANDALTAIMGAALMAVIAGFAWWLGTGLARDHGYPLAVTRFQVGLLLLVVMAPFGRFVLPLALTFCILYAFSLACARWSETRDFAPEILRKPSAPTLLWAGSLVIGITLLLLLAVSPSVIRQIGSAFANLSGWLRLEQLPAGDTQPLDWRISCDFKPEDEGFVLPEAPSGEPTPADPVVVWVFSGIILAGLLAAVVMAAIMMRRRKSGKRAGPELYLVSTRSQISLAEVFKGWLDGLRGIMKALGSVMRRWYRSLVGNAGAVSNAGTVRECYRHLLSWAAECGWPRMPSQTPTEYACALSQVFPEGQNEIRVITDHYLEARYCRDWQDNLVVVEVRGAWSRLRLMRKPLINTATKPD